MADLTIAMNGYPVGTLHRSPTDFPAEISEAIFAGLLKRAQRLG